MTRRWACVWIGLGVAAAWVGLGRAQAAPLPADPTGAVEVGPQAPTGSFTLTSVAHGAWGEPTTWDHGSRTPTSGDCAVVRNHTVMVNTDGAARSLRMEHVDGRVVVGPGKTLAITDGLDVAAGVLDVVANASAYSGGSLTLGENSRYLCELGSEATGVLASSGGVVLSPGSGLSLRATGKLGPYGDTARAVLVAIGSGLISGTFTQVPVAGEHLGWGVFYEGMSYAPHTVSVELFQAAEGDTNGDRYLDGYDIQAILSANTFATGAPADWTTGDFDGDGLCTGYDIQAILATNLWDPLSSHPYAAVSPRTGTNASRDLQVRGRFGGTPIAVPEPPAMAMVVAGLVGLLAARWRRR